MSNLIRGAQDYLLNTIGPKEFGMYYQGDVATGIKHLVCKKYGIDIPFDGDTTIVKKTSAVGAAAVITLTPAFVAKTAGDQRVIEIEITRQPLYDGAGNHQFPVSHTYGMKLTNTATIANDKQTVVDGLVEAINADVARTSNAVNTGASVVATRTGAAGTSALVLTAKEKGQPITVRIFDENFTQVLTTKPKKDTLTNDQLSRLFMIKAENEGQRVTIPTEGVDYCCVTIASKTLGYENVSASAFIKREQVYNFYMPLVLTDDVLFADIAVAANGIVPSMADVVAAPAKAFNDYLAYNVNLVPVTSIGTTTATKTLATTTGTFAFAPTIMVAPGNASNKTITYVSSVPAKATVDVNTGLVTGVAAGTTTITATSVDGSYTTTCVVTVP